MQGSLTDTQYEDACADPKLQVTGSNEKRMFSFEVNNYIIKNSLGVRLPMRTRSLPTMTTWPMAFTSTAQLLEQSSGVRISVDNFGLLAPYISSASAILLLAIYVERVKRRKEKQ